VRRWFEPVLNKILEKNEHKETPDMPETEIAKRPAYTLPAYITLGGIEIFDGNDVPPGEIWLEAPLPEGGKVRYMFNLNDHRMTLKDNNGESFLDWVDNRLEDLRELTEAGLTRKQMTCVDRIQVEIANFKRGKARVATS